MLTFLHGFLGSPNDWNDLNLPGKFLILPGHQNRPLDLSIIDKDIPSKTTLIGYSLGGRLAMHFAKKYPNRIEKLIILSANPGLETGRSQRIVMDERWAKILELEGLNTFLKNWYAQPLFATLNKKKLLDRDKHNPIYLARILRELSPAKLPSLWNDLNNFSFPMLFLFGKNDEKYQDVSKRLSKNFNVKMVPKSGHSVHIENPEFCSQAIQTFLGEHNDYNS